MIADGKMINVIIDKEN